MTFHLSSQCVVWIECTYLSSDNTENTRGVLPTREAPPSFGVQSFYRGLIIYIWMTTCMADFVSSTFRAINVSSLSPYITSLTLTIHMSQRPQANKATLIGNGASQGLRCYFLRAKDRDRTPFRQG